MTVGRPGSLPHGKSARPLDLFLVELLLFQIGFICEIFQQPIHCLHVLADILIVDHIDP